jgi:hypothetical protein
LFSFFSQHMELRDLGRRGSSWEEDTLPIQTNITP